MNKFEQIKRGIYRLKNPFDTVWTSVFLLQNEKGSVLLDTATTEYDVRNYIVPALEHRNTVPDHILCSHRHSDHAGGFPLLAEQYPGSVAHQTPECEDGVLLLGQFQILALKGHTWDCIGILDVENAILLVCDGLQQKGVDKYRTFVEDPAAYRDTIRKLRGMEVKTVICSHDYEPMGDIIEGTEKLLRLYEICEKTV